MILYHFTALEYLESILKNGLNKGDIPIARDEGSNAVWFTTDANPSGHGLTDGRLLTEQEHKQYLKNFGSQPNPGARFADKRKIKIEVVIPSSDRNLNNWLPWARKRLSPEWLETVISTGGGKAKARTWYIYNGVVRPEVFRSVSVRDDAGTYHPHSTAEAAAVIGV